MRTFTLRCADMDKREVEGIQFNSGVVSLDTGQWFANHAAFQKWLEGTQYMVSVPAGY